MSTSQYGLTKTTIFNVEYNIPRHMIGLPGRQNRTGDGRMRITPGMAEPMEFIWGNVDGVPINLTGMSVKLLFWRTNRFRDTAQAPNLSTLDPGHSDVVLSKVLVDVDPHAGRATVLLAGDDTAKLVASGDATTIRWGLFLINGDGEIFPTQVTTAGARYGQVVFDLESGTPTVEMIKGS